MLRIEKGSDGQATIVGLSGRIQSQYLHESQVQIDSCTQKTALDLDELKLVDRAAVHFLGLTKKTALITGGNSGIGLATARGPRLDSDHA